MQTEKGSYTFENFEETWKWWNDKETRQREREVYMIAVWEALQEARKRWASEPDEYQFWLNSWDHVYKCWWQEEKTWQ